jgi:DNA-binding transcriptional LysR family regulator
MELRQLRAFVAAATEGHFGRAATSLNLTQPGLTLRIQALERELGAQLLERSSREVLLTATGTVLLPHAKSLIRIEDRALRELRDQADGIAGRLRIAYLSNGEVAMPAKVVAEFRRRYPSVQIETSAAHSSVNAEHLRQGNVDAAFVHPGFVRVPDDISDEVAVRHLGRDAIMLALSPDHQLARLERVPVSALRSEPLIIFASSPHSGFILTMERWLARVMGAKPNIVGYEPPDQALEAVGRSTSLITFTTESRMAFAPVPGIAYRHLSPQPLLDFGIAYYRDDPSPTLANLLQLIDKMTDGEPGELPGDSVLLTAEEVEPGPPAVAASRRPRQAPTLE